MLLQHHQVAASLASSSPQQQNPFVRSHQMEISKSPTPEATTTNGKMSPRPDHNGNSDGKSAADSAASSPASAAVPAFPAGFPGAAAAGFPFPLHPSMLASLGGFNQAAAALNLTSHLQQQGKSSPSPVSSHDHEGGGGIDAEDQARRERRASGRQLSSSEGESSPHQHIPSVRPSIISDFSPCLLSVSPISKLLDVSSWAHRAVFCSQFSHKIFSLCYE